MACYVTKKYVGRVGKKEIERIRKDNENDFHTPPTIFNSFDPEKGAFFDYAGFIPRMEVHYCVELLTRALRAPLV